MANRASDSITLKNIEIGYEHLLEPTPKLSGDGMEYSVQITIPKDHPQTGELKKLVGGQIKQIFPDIDPSKLTIALRDNDKEGNAKKYDYLENTLFFNARRQTKKGRVPIVSRYNKPLVEVSGDTLFSGCICNVVVNFFTFNHPSSKGVAASIEAVQIVDNVNVQRRDGQVDTSNAFEALEEDENIDSFAPGGDGATEEKADKPDSKEQKKPDPEEEDDDLPW